MMNDLTGQRFGRLVALRPTHRRYSTGAVLWACRCDCRKRVTVPSASLLSGHTRSCGCLCRDSARKQINENRPKISACLRHGGMSKFSDPRLVRAYRIYRGMICRCCNSHAPNWRFYGGMGVQIDARWLGENGFKHFVADCGLPKIGDSISRWMDCGDYGPQNAHFATAKEQRAEKAKKRRFIQQTLKAELRIGPYGSRRKTKTAAMTEKS